MENLYRLLSTSLSLEQAWDLLTEAKIDILYGAQEEEQTEIYVKVTSPKILSSLEWVTHVTPYTLPKVDWEAQWAAHSQNFQEGHVHIDFNSLGRKAPSLRLKPGAGFGDLSHPTTCLMLRLLARHLNHHLVIDIGCGSGVLTLAAAAMGAPLVYGLDIDQDALIHSRENALLNQLHAQCIFSDPAHFQWEPTRQPLLTLMNMIQSEQQIAWAALPNLHHQTGLCLTSGIQVHERRSYLALTKRWGWTLQHEEEEKGWLAFHFSLSSLLT